MENKRLQQLLTFLEKDPADAFTRYSIAYEYMNAGNAAEAARHFEALLTQHPDYLGAYYHYGNCLLALEQREKAEHIFETGMEKARTARDTHTLSELQAAYNNMMYED